MGWYEGMGQTGGRVGGWKGGRVWGVEGWAPAVAMRKLGLGSTETSLQVRCGASPDPRRSPVLALPPTASPGLEGCEPPPARVAAAVTAAADEAKAADTEASVRWEPLERAASGERDGGGGEGRGRSPADSRLGGVVAKAAALRSPIIKTGLR